MKYKHFFLFFQILILCNTHNFITVNALKGCYVRLTEQNEFPAVVALSFINIELTEEENIFCTGTLITYNHIVTCEHCFDITQNEPYRIIADSNDLSFGRTYFPAWWLSYDQWCRKRRIRITESDNDIAIVKIFARTASYIIPMNRTNISRNREYFGRIAKTAGWGVTDDYVLPSILRTINMTIISNNNCMDKIHKIGGERILVPGKFFCTNDIPYALTAPGDSGSPLIVDDLLIAIAKGAAPHLNGEFHPGKVNVYLSVQRYNNFIDNVIH